MTHALCPGCRLRFTRAAAAYLEVCPACGEPPQHVTGAQAAIGFRLFTPQELSDDLPAAIATAIAVREPDRPPS